MNVLPFIALFSTAVIVAACARGCEPGRDILPKPEPTLRITDKPLPSPTPTATSTPVPTMVMKTYVVPQAAKVKEPFTVRAYVGSMDIVEVFAGEYRLGFMGWDSACKCKSLTITLNTAGEREIIFSKDGVALASEMVLVEEK